jgi:hypothetical protein
MESLKDVVCLGGPIAPGEGEGGWVAGSQRMSTAVHMEI